MFIPWNNVWLKTKIKSRLIWNQVKILVAHGCSSLKCSEFIVSIKLLLNYLLVLIYDIVENFSGSQAGNSGKAKLNVDIPVKLAAGKNRIDLLSLTVGLQVQFFWL